jgi:plastocyanin
MFAVAGTATAQDIEWNTTVGGDGMTVDVNDAYNDTHMVYTVNNDAVYMAEQSTGNVAWSSADGQDNYLDTAATGPEYVYSGEDSNAWVHDHSGTEIYSPRPSDCCKEAIFPDAQDYFYISDESETIFVFNKSNGSQVYSHNVVGFRNPSSMYVEPDASYVYINNNSHTQVYSGIPSSLNLEESWQMPNGGIDDYASDSVYADDSYFYFSGDDGNVSVAEKGTWNYIENISATGANVWSVDSDENYVYYASHDGNVYIHEKSRSEGFPLVERVDVGGGLRANSVDSDGEFVFYATDDEVGAIEAPAPASTSTSSGNTPPIAEFNVSEPVVAGETVTFDGSASRDPDGEIVLHRWEIEGTPSQDLVQYNKNGETTTHTFPDPGEYEVYFKVDDGSKIDTVTKIVTVEENLNEQAEQNVTEEGNVTDGNETDTGEDTGDSGTDDGTGEELDGFDLPPLPPETGEEVTLEAGDVGLEGNITEYEWTVDGEVVGTEEVVSYIFDSSGEFNVTLSVSDDTGGNATFTRTISVEGVNEEMENQQEQTEMNETEETEDMQENVTEDETENETNQETDEEGEGLPGFTAIAALVAALVVVSRRRA